MQRRLAAILAADIAGYSRLMHDDESATVRDLKAHQSVILPLIGRHGGRIIDTAGDGIMAEFPSVIGGTECAVEIQTIMAARNEQVPEQRRMLFRIGINLGDVIHDDTRIYGDGINVAARLEGLAEPGGVLVSRAVHDQVRDRLDLTFQDLGEQELKNIARPVHVYRLVVASLRTSRPGAPATSDSPRLQVPRLTLPDRPSLVVLPFQNMSADSEQEYFADGMVEDITTALSQIRWLFVIARNSAFTYKGRAVDVRQVGHELGVRYVVEGSVRRAGERVRITAQLVEADGGRHIWADRFDGTMSGVFDVQDRVTGAVAAALEPRLRQVETERAQRKSTADLTAYDLYLRALPHYYSKTAASDAAALSLLEAAIARDPGFAQATALLARAIANGMWFGWQVDYVAAKRRAEHLARHALALDPSDPFVLAVGGYVLAVVCGEHELGGGLLTRAIELNPNFAEGWIAAAWGASCSGQLELALERFTVAERLDPLSPDISEIWHGRGVAHYFSGRFEDAVAEERRSMGAKPEHAGLRTYLIAALVGQGEFEAARMEVSALLRLQPSRTLRRTRETNHYRGWMMEMYLDALRRAGIPE
jgi:adenylate cyclase